MSMMLMIVLIAVLGIPLVGLLIFGIVMLCNRK